MGDISDSGAAAFFGSKSQISVTRALAEFHARRPVRVVARGVGMLALPVDGLDARRFEAFRKLCAPAVPRLVLTRERARAIGIHSDAAASVELDRSATAERVLALAADSKVTHSSRVDAAPNLAQAAIDLAKLAQSLPAVLVGATEGGQSASPIFDIVSIEAQAVTEFAEEMVRSLTISGRACIPLTSGSRAEFVVFRDVLGGTSTAIIIGKPDYSRPVPVRLHSACLTGDVFGSRRCDCGDQLKLAVKRLEEEGAGIILYLPQEGRGVGLANKMRAYQMQDEGLDTVDANTSLGFHDDERDYKIAGSMLQMLGCRSVVLLTNNPAKLQGLSRTGIDIASRMPIETPVNADNLRYMTAKAARAGHQLGHLLGLDEAAEMLQETAAAE